MGREKGKEEGECACVHNLMFKEQEDKAGILRLGDGKWEGGETHWLLASFRLVHP